MQTLSLSLPYPPSQNHYWMSLRRGPLAGRVIISTAGKKYRDAIVRSTSIPPGWNPDARMGVAIVAHPPDRRRRDIDNLLKPLLDALMHSVIFTDDCQIDDLRISRGDIIREGMVDVVVQQLQAQI